MEYKLLVPVRTTAAGTFILRFGRLPSGRLTGLAFTSEDSLMRTLGPSQQWTDLSWEALLDMLTPLGVEHISVDPVPDGEPAMGGAPDRGVRRTGITHRDGCRPVPQASALRRG